MLTFDQELEVARRRTWDLTLSAVDTRICERLRNQHSTWGDAPEVRGHAAGTESAVPAQTAGPDLREAPLLKKHGCFIEIFLKKHATHSLRQYS